MRFVNPTLQESEPRANPSPVRGCGCVVCRTARERGNYETGGKIHTKPAAASSSKELATLKAINDLCVSGVVNGSTTLTELVLVLLNRVGAAGRQPRVFTHGLTLSKEDVADIYGEQSAQSGDSAVSTHTSKERLVELRDRMRSESKKTAECYTCYTDLAKHVADQLDVVLSSSHETPACAVLMAAEALLEVLPVPNDYYGDEAQALRDALDANTLKAGDGT